MKRNKAFGIGAMCLLVYVALYLALRPFPARYAPFALGRPWSVFDIRQSVIPWPRFSTRHPSIAERVRQHMLEPAAYYLFMPLVEADLALNGHPGNPKHKWKFFGDNYD